MSKPLQNTVESCPRCGHSFDCQPANIHNCHCRQVPLEASVLEKISKNWEGCLCQNCLRALSEEFSESTK